MKKKLLMNVLVLVLAVAMIAAATMAWFTDNADAGDAIFTAGTVSIEAGRKIYIDDGEFGNSDTLNGTFYPIRVVDYQPGKQYNGNPVKSPRNEPDNALGAPESGQNENNFCSLGFGGSIILEFDHALYVPTLAIVVEDTWGGNYPLEEADVYVSNTGEDDDWDYIGRANNENLHVNQTISEFTFDLVDIPYVKFVKIVDVTNRELFSNMPTAEGFDLNAVSIEGYTQEEDNWNPGDCNERAYFIINTGTKAINLRGKLSGKWYEYNEESKQWKRCNLSASVVTFNLLDGETDWKKNEDDGYFYFNPESPEIPGTFSGASVDDRTRELRIKVCLDGPNTGNRYQGKRFIVSAEFEAIQSSNNAPYYDTGWSTDIYGVPVEILD